MLAPDVEWPDVANSAVLHGPEAVRPHWLAQFATADPRVEPTDLLTVGDEVVAVVRPHVFARRCAADRGRHRVQPVLVTG